MRDYEKVRDLSIERLFVNSRGNFKKYPLKELAVGEACFIYKGESGYKSIRSYVYSRGLALRKKFSCSEFNDGMQIKCVAIT
jgi:hypothetical protein